MGLAEETELSSIESAAATDDSGEQADDVSMLLPYKMSIFQPQSLLSGNTSSEIHVTSVEFNYIHAVRQLT